jgi:HD domain-containing protein
LEGPELAARVGLQRGGGTNMPMCACPMNRRCLLVAGVTALLALGVPRRFAVRATATALRDLPDEIAGIRLPLSADALAAAALAREASPPFLYNHSIRTYVFGALIGNAGGLAFDQESIFIAACLHDLGLLDRYQSKDEPFELDSAAAARAFLTARGVADSKIDLVCDAIAYHTSALASLRAPQVGLVGAGAGADVFGYNLSSLPPARVAEVVTALPRLNFKNDFQRSLISYCRKKPRAQIGTWTDAFCRSHVSTYKFPSIDERLAQSPFSE